MITWWMVGVALAQDPYPGYQAGWQGNAAPITAPTQAPAEATPPPAAEPVEAAPVEAAPAEAPLDLLLDVEEEPAAANTFQAPAEAPRAG